MQPGFTHTGFTKWLKIPFYALVLSIFVLGLTSCEEDFETRAENTEYFFSVYGYLDATVDTQWIRIVPVRQDFDPIPGEIDATVTLRNLDSGEITAMNDSLFNPNDLVVHWNFWTTEEIEYGGVYELTATRSDGVESSVILTIPDDYPTPIFASINGTDYVFISKNVNHIADIQVVYKVREVFKEIEHIFSFSHIADSVDDPNFRIFRLSTTGDLAFLERYFETVEAELIGLQVFVAAAGAGWINLYEVDEDVYTLAEGVSNIENGVGYAVGTVTKTIPWGSCYEVIGDESTIVPCELMERFR